MFTFVDIIERSNKVAADQFAAAFPLQTANTAQYILSQNEIRMLVYNSSGMGHQACTVNILFSLVALGYQNNVTIWVPEDDVRPELVAKLRLLMPQFQMPLQTFQVGSANVMVRPLGSRQLAPISFGILGGFDDDQTFPFRQFNVKNLVILQPYRWTRGTDMIVRTRGEAREETDLDNVGGLHLQNRAYYLPVPDLTPNDIQILNNALYGRETEVVQALVNAIQTPGINLCPTYGITTLMTYKPEVGLYNVVAGILEAQSTSVRGAKKPAVVVSLGTIDETYWDRLQELIFMGKASRTGWGVVTPSTDFTNWHKDRQVAQRVKVLPDALTLTKEKIEEAIGELNSGQVLVVNLGKVPLLLFNYLYAKATLPPVLEGQSTTDLILNLGVPYLKLLGEPSARNIMASYPTLPISAQAPGRYANYFSSLCANVVTVDPDRWSVATSSRGQLLRFPPTNGALLVKAFTDPQSSGRALDAYFKALGLFFHNKINDKLMLSLNYLVNDLGVVPVPDQVVALAVGEIRAPDENPIQTLYDKLGSSIQGGVLDYFKAVTEGALYEFFWGLLGGNSLNITVKELNINDEKTIVVLTGETSGFGVGATEVSFVFTWEQNNYHCEFAAEFLNATWSLINSQWLSINNLGLDLTLQNGATIPATGEIVATVTAGKALKLGISFPAEGDVIILQASFANGAFTVADVFQMVGGINLTALLPPQIAGASQIGLSGLGLAYNMTPGEEKVEYFSVDLAYDKDTAWDLIPGVVSIKGLSLNIVVYDPGDLQNRYSVYNFSGSFGIGDGTVEIGAQLPALSVTGQLAPDSAPISLDKLIRQFVDLPVPLNADIEALNFSYQSDPSAYSLGCRVKTDWPIPPGAQNPVFTVTGLEFFVLGGSGKGQGGFSGTIVILPETEKIGLNVSATYGGQDAGWTFAGRQISGQIRLGALLKEYLHWDTDQDYGIDGLSLTITTKDNSWVFTGKTAQPWEVPFLSGLTVSASLTAGYNGTAGNAETLPAVAASSMALRLAAGGCQGTGYFGRLETEWNWNNIDLKVWFDYCPDVKKFGITWGVLEGTVTGPNAQGDWVASLKFTKGVTLGSMVETMVSWMTGSKFGLEAPWNFLDSISLSNLALNYTFNRQDSTRNHVSFSVNLGPINLGFARIDSIDISYQSSKGVLVTLKGSFPWNVGPNSVGDASSLGPWDASKPGTAPAPPGNGNKYFDLRLLAMGQHVTMPCFKGADTVQKAIDCMKQMPDPKPGEVPPVEFDAESSWLIGTEFGVLQLQASQSGDGQALVRRGETALAAPPGGGYFLTMQLVFNDPYLYALRIKLDGEPAKIFKGLDFQIMYRQVSETVGVYQADITLPDVMRHLSIGAYSITLPVFGIAVYTNGDFQVDIGFPWNEDFSRSFTVEGIIYPGIPVTGSAGFYFGKLSSATTNKVPQITNGTFNPVIVFGFGMQIGFGKSIQYGILSAGFSLTVVGILEGVIAKFNPYQITDGGDKSQVQGAYYFWLRGTVGIIGKLYGTVDFAIIKADVRVEIKLLLQLTYESFVSISITVIASVDVSVSIEINLGIFSFSIDFSFSMRLKETFTMKVGGTPPWQLAGDPSPGILRAPAERRLRAHREAAAMTLLLAEMPATNWANLQKPAQPAPLTGYLAPALAVAHDEWQGGQNPQDQSPCYVAVMVINSVPPANQDAQTSVLKAAGAQADTPFETLCKTTLCWVIAAIQGKPMTQAEVEQQVITDTDLAYLLDKVLVSTDDSPTPIPLDAVQSFLSDQFRLTIRLPDQTSPPPTTYFPVAPALRLSTPQYGEKYPGYTYTFADYNSLDASTLATLRAYFDELAVQVEREMKPPHRAMAQIAAAPLSMASWILTDYFLLITRQMVQAAREALRDFKYPIQPGQTCNALVRWVNNTGHLTSDDNYTLQDLLTANTTHALSSGKPLTIGVNYQVGLSDTFDSIAEHLPGGQLTAVSLATANAANDKLLTAGAKITYPQKPDYTVQPGDTLVGIAKVFGVKFSDLLVGSGVLRQEGLLAENAALVLPYVSYQALSSDTFNSIASLQIYGGAFSDAALATQNASASILQPGAKVSYQGQSYQVIAGDCLGDVAAHFGVSLSALLSGSGVLTQTGLLAPVAVLAVPPFKYQTVAGDEPQSIAARFGVTVDVLAEETSNGEVADLFATVDSSNKSTPFLDVPHLPQFQVGELIKEAQRALALQHLSGMASRYYLHGLRLPTAGIKPNKPGMWVRQQGADLTLPPRCGLYALTGQQFPLPTIQSGNDFKITLDRAAGPDWLLFDDGHGTSVNQLVITIAPDSTNARSIASVTTYARANRLNVGLTQLGAEPMYESNDATYPFTSALVWQSADAVTLPYGTPPAGLPSLRLWKLPDALVNLPDPATRAVNPRLSARVARYDEATGATVRTPVGYYGWASTVAFTVKRIPPVGGSPGTKMTYEVVGAGGSGIILLERLLRQVGGDEAFFDQLILGYQPNQLGDATQGVQTDPLRSLTFGIAQVNLSTETRPPSLAFKTALVADEPTGLGLLNNSKGEFVRLLWEASITRAGGFYLYYYNADGGSGLPDRIFNDKNEAELTLILTYAKPSSVPDQNRLTDFMNAIVTGETIDTTHAVVFAQADPPSDPPPTVTSAADDSLSVIAYRYYSDVGDLAQANARLPLTAGKTIVVSEGVYQSPVGGISLSTVAGNFGTTVAELQSANPRWKGRLPDPLPFPEAIRLPRLTLTTVTSAHTSTLGDIASYYGENLTSLAADNRDVKGIFAAGQQVSITGGPRVRSATVPPGVEAVAASRPAPPPVPGNPQDPKYGEYFLLNAYSLLNYSVAESVYFSPSNMGLPAGPTASPQDETNNDKIRAPRKLAEGDPWNYHQALPFPKFAKSSTGKAAALPDPGLSPYVGVGYLLQVTFDWQDYYGNTLVTTLSAPQAGDAGPYNQSPMLTGYTDPLVGLGQWPSVSSSWEVLPGDAVGKPRLELLLTFDSTRYQGLLSASAGNATTVLAVFTDDLDPASAANKDNYQLGDTTVQSATLNADQRTVQLTVSPALSEGESYTLTVSGVRATDVQDAEASFSGQAVFNYQGDPSQRSSTVQENAANDLRVYTDLYYQLNDANGIAYTIQSSLLKGDDGGPGSFTLSAAQVQSLLAWLFEGSDHGSSIFALIYDRSTFGATVAAPPSANPIVTDLDVARINDAQIFELSLSFLIARTGGVVLGDLETTPGIRQSATAVAPLTKNLGGGGDRTVGLNQFAQNFESALSSPASYLMKVATGVNRVQLSTARNGSAVWAVRLGLTSAQPISYAITAKSAADPAVFAPQPISNKLQTRKVDIYDYVTGQGISSQPTRQLDFVDIDMDVWGQKFFGAIDGVLMPEFTAAIQIVGKQPSVDTDYLQQILDRKKKVAQIAKLWMIPVFKGDSPDASAVREALYQQLLSRLMNAYTTRAGIQYTAGVNANIQDPLADQPPRLFGGVVLNGPTFESATADPESLNTVTLLFSAVMDSASAQDVANYNVSGGLQVQTAALSGGGSVVVLGLLGDVTIGSTTVTASHLKDAQGRALRLPLTQTVQTSAASGQAKSEIGFTSPKLVLASGTQPLPFLLTASETVRGAGGQVVSYLDLDLVYEGTQIEHQIGKVKGIEGYLASSWLSFVVQNGDLPLEQELGQCKVPLILRSFPASPAMTAQSQCLLPASPLTQASAPTEREASASDCDDIVIGDLTKWNYCFTYSLPFHYPQDRIYGEVEFNIARNDLRSMASFTDAFAPLAEFVTVFPDVNKDLEGILATIDATIDPNKPDDKKKIDDASVALKSFVKLVGDVTDAAGPAGLAMRPAVKLFSGTESLTFSFTIQDCSVDVGTTQAALLVVLTVTGTPPEGIGEPLILVDPDNYDCVRYEGQDCDGQDCNKEGRFCFVYKKKGADEYLTAAVGQTLAAREVVLPGMDILQRQDSWATVYLKRNEDLVPGKKLADAFVYQTPAVQFANPFHPTIDSDTKVSIPCIDSPTPVTRPLQQQLETLFDALLKNNSEPTLTFQVEVSYLYNINPNLPDPVSLPVLMQPPLKVQTEGTGGGTLSQMIADWAAALDLWFSTYAPKKEGGTYLFALAIMSNLTSEPMPLLRLRNVILPIEYIASSSKV